MSIETQLRDALAARADDVDLSTADPYARVSGAVRTSVRRRRTALAGVAAAAVATAVLVPGLLRPGADRATTPATHTTTVAPRPSDPAWRSMSTWPTRGGLAGDKALVAAVEDKAAGHVVFIDDAGSKRVAIVVDATQKQIAVLDGPAGAPAAQLAVTTRGDAAATLQGDVLTLTVDGSRTVILTTPDVRTAEVSDQPDIHVDGTVSRQWQTVRLANGMAQVPMGSNVLRVRVSGSDQSAMFGVGQAAGTEDLQPTVCGDCRGEAFQSAMVSFARDSVSLLLGVVGEQIETDAVYAGPVDPVVAEAAGLPDAIRAGSETLLFVGHSTLPGGQVLQTAQLTLHGKDGTAQTMGFGDAVPIDARTAFDRPFVLAGNGPAGKGGNGVRIQVFAHTGATAQLVSNSPTIWPSSGVLPLRAATARVDLSGLTLRDFNKHYEVVLRDATGSELGRYPVELPNTGDPFAETP
jgi:hypothetical protein